MRHNMEKSSTKSMSYGRFNPVTKAHDHVYNRVIAVKDADCYIFASAKTGDKKNPLTPEQKLPFLKKQFKAATVEIVAGGYIEAFKRLSPADKLVIVVGGDRIDVVEKLANKYNHKEYEFKQIEVLDAGSRQHDTLSATKMRQWTLDNDKESFFKGCSDKLSAQDKQKLFDLTRSQLLKLTNK